MEDCEFRRVRFVRRRSSSKPLVSERALPAAKGRRQSLLGQAASRVEGGALANPWSAPSVLLSGVGSSGSVGLLRSISIALLCRCSSGVRAVVPLSSVLVSRGGSRSCGGGERLRKYCDKKNIYYKSVLDSNGNLLSVTTMEYQKKDNEDCRVPTKVELHG